MSDHLDHDDSTGGKTDPRVDITDLFVFTAPDDPSRSILLMNVNPFAPSGGIDSSTDALYEILIDTNADTLPDIPYRIAFTKVDGGQTATVRKATGPAAAVPGDDGDVLFDAAPVSLDGSARVSATAGRRFFAGLRSDPFFFDLKGYLDHLTFTGSDMFVDKNVFGIALDLPSSELCDGAAIAIWCRVLVRSHGKLLQIDRMGRPLVNVALTKSREKTLLNQTEPQTDLKLFPDIFANGLRRLGGDAMDQADAVARSLLPDVLPFDPSQPAGYPNGRQLADDIIDHQLALFTAGRVTSDGAAAHLDLLPQFPYLGEPHA